VISSYRHPDQFVLGPKNPSTGSLAHGHAPCIPFKQLLRESAHIPFEDFEELISGQFFKSLAVVDPVARDYEGIEGYGLGENEIPFGADIEQVHVPLAEEGRLGVLWFRVEVCEVDFGFDFGCDSEGHGRMLPLIRLVNFS